MNFKSAVLWEQAMFSRLLTCVLHGKYALLRDQKFLSTLNRNGVTEHNFDGSFHAKNES